jgi:hypothetical protein
MPDAQVPLEVSKGDFRTANNSNGLFLGPFIADCLSVMMAVPGTVPTFERLLR